MVREEEWTQRIVSDETDGKRVRILDMTAMEMSMSMYQSSSGRDRWQERRSGHSVAPYCVGKDDKRMRILDMTAMELWMSMYQRSSGRDRWQKRKIGNSVMPDEVGGKKKAMVIWVSVFQRSLVHDENTRERKQKAASISTCGGRRFSRSQSRSAAKFVYVAVVLMA